MIGAAGAVLNAVRRRLVAHFHLSALAAELERLGPVRGLVVERRRGGDVCRVVVRGDVADPPNLS